MSMPTSTTEVETRMATSPRRHLVKDRDVEITEECQPEGARNRRGGHRQKVRGALTLLPDRQALTNTETVLLVDDSQREVLELDALLDERVRPNEHREVSVGQRREHRLSCRGGRAPHQEPHIDLEWSEE